MDPTPVRRSAWDALPHDPRLDAQTLFAAIAAELGRYDTVTLAAYLDRSLPGLLREYATTLVAACLPFLEEVLPFDREVRRQLEDPVGVFGLRDPVLLKLRFQAVHPKQLHHRNWAYVKRTISAHMYLAVGDAERAARGAVLALAAKRNTLIGEDEPLPDPRIQATLLLVERECSHHLVELIRKRRTG